MKELKSWENKLLTDGKSKKTVSAYMSDMKLLLDWIKTENGLGDIDLDIIKCLTLRDLQGFMSYCMNDRGNGESTRARRVNAIKSLFAYLFENNLISENVSDGLTCPKIPRRLPKYLTKEESIKLLNSIGGYHKARDMAIIRTVLNVGLRKEEIINMNVSDLGEEYEVIKDGIIHRCMPINVIGKGNKERKVIISHNTIDAIKKWLKIRPDIQGNDALFISERNNRMSVGAITNLINNNLKAIGREDCSIHRLRHTSATLMLDNGVDLRTIQETLGHNSPTTTAIYTHVSNKQKEAASICTAL